MAIKTFKGLKSELKKIRNRIIAEALMAEGKRLVDLAVSTSTFKNRTFSLRSSMACCLYYDGKEFNSNLIGKNVGMESFVSGVNEIPSRYYSNIHEVDNETLRKINGEPKTAYDCLDEFFEAYKAPKGKWQLVVVAAMPYASFVEEKGYQVLSMVGAEMSTSAPATMLGGVVKDVLSAPEATQAVHTNKWW